MGWSDPPRSKPHGKASDLLHGPADQIGTILVSFERFIGYAARLARHDQVRVVWAEAGTASALFETLVSLHTRRWEASGQPGVLSDPAVLAFHRDAVPRLQASHLLRMSALSIDGAIVGAYYGLAYRKRAYGHLNGSDPSLGFDSPGTALLGSAIQGAIAEGCSEFVFLRGKEPYKYAWRATDSWNVARQVRSGPPSEHSGGSFLWTDPDQIGQ